MSNRARVDATLRANRAHQEQVKSYIERLEAELAAVDSLLETAGTKVEQDEEHGPSESGIIDIPGSIKPTSLILLSGLLDAASPFHADAQWRETYEKMTTLNPMKGKEQEALRRAVRVENERLATLAAQARGSAASASKDASSSNYEMNKEGLDWKRIANRVSDSSQSTSGRTPEECEIRWLGHLHPDINKSPWSSKELADLKELVKQYGNDDHIDWTVVSEKLGSKRSPFDCMCHGTERIVHIWTPESDKKLLEGVQMYGESNWSLVAISVSEDATAHQCQKRYFDTLDPNMRRGNWSDEEDTQLLRAVAAFTITNQSSSGSTISWQDVALFIPGRTNNQCREHYQAKFKTKPKGGASINAANSSNTWLEEEDARLREAISTHPDQWKEISEYVGGNKTAEMCQSRFRVLSKEAGDTSDPDAPPAKRSRKSAAPKPRARKANKNVAEESEEQTKDGQHCHESIENSDTQARKRRARPQPRKKSVTTDASDQINTDVEIISLAGGSGSAREAVMSNASVVVDAVDEQVDDIPSQNPENKAMQIDESQPVEPLQKRERLSAKARGKQKAVEQDLPTDETGVDEPRLGSSAPPSATQKRRQKRTPKANVNDQNSIEVMEDQPSEPLAGGDDVQTATPMDVDASEASNRRRSMRIKNTKK